MLFILLKILMKQSGIISKQLSLIQKNLKVFIIWVMLNVLEMIIKQQLVLMKVH